MFLVCGEALYDVFVGSEDAGGGLGLEGRPGGSPFNVAIGMARQGVASGLLTGMSDDVFGAKLAGMLAREGVDCRYLVRTPRRTTLSVVGTDEQGVPAYSFYGADSADCSLTEAELPALGNEVTGLHFGSYSIAVKPVADAFAALAGVSNDRFISLDPNIRPTIEPDMAVWRARVDAMRMRAGLVKVSDEDLGIMYPGADPLEVVAGWAKDGPALVVLSRGGEALTAFRGTEMYSAQPPKVQVIDTVGAGDTLMASLLVQVGTQPDPVQHIRSMTGGEVEALLHRSGTAAAITCSRRGADLPTANDIDATLRGGA